MKKCGLSRVLTDSVIGAALLISSTAVERERSLRPKQVPNSVHEPSGGCLEDEISQTELPRKVSDALESSENTGAGSVERIERIAEPATDEAARFEIALRTRDRKLELTFDGDGRLLRKEAIRNPR